MSSSFSSLLAIVTAASFEKQKQAKFNAAPKGLNIKHLSLPVCWEIIAYKNA